MKKINLLLLAILFISISCTKTSNTTSGSSSTNNSNTSSSHKDSVIVIIDMWHDLTATNDSMDIDLILPLYPKFAGDSVCRQVHFNTMKTHLEWHTNIKASSPTKLNYNFLAGRFISYPGDSVKMQIYLNGNLYLHSYMTGMAQCQFQY